MGSVLEKQLFDFVESLILLDKDGDGRTALEELATIVKSFGSNLNSNEDELVDMISKVNLGSGNADFGEFLIQMFRKLKGIDAEENDAEDEVEEVFKVFDKDQDGFISANELRNVMISLGEKLTDGEAEQMIREADWDGDGLVNYDDFTRLMATI